MLDKAPRSSRQLKSRYGYDWYTSTDQSGRDVLRGFFRKSRAPGWLEVELQSVLPDELTWPNGSISEAHALVEHLMRGHVDEILYLQKTFPDVRFGFEDIWLPWAVSKIYHPESKTKAHITPKETSIEHLDLLTTRVINQAKDLHLDFHVARIHGGDAWGLASFRTSHSFLTKAWVDLPTNIATAYFHKRGRWKALGIKETMVTDVLGADALRRFRPATPLEPDEAPLV